MPAPLPPLAFIHDLRAADLPDRVVAQARRCLIDLVGVAAAGAGTPMARLIADHAADQFAAGGTAARIMFDGRRVSPAGAALAGGMAIDSFDAHDGHKLTKGHAGCGALPALLALFDATDGRDGWDFLTGLVIGYEIGTRAGIALHRTAADYHTSGAWVALAAAALGARMLGLSGEATREALGIAEYHGPRSPMMRCIDHPTMVKDGSGWGAMAGISAAYLAQSGFTGAPAAIVEDSAVTDIWGDLGTRWRIEEQYFKLFPVCRWAQPAVEAVLAAMAETGATAGDLANVEIVSFHEAVRLATPRPTTTEAAQYSTPFAVAAALVRGTIGAAEIGREGFTDPDILAWSERIVLREDTACNEAFPDRRLARAVLTLNDGRRIETALTEAKGDPEAPLGEDQVRAKFHALAEPALGERRADSLERLIDGLGELADARALAAALCRPGGDQVS